MDLANLTVAMDRFVASKGWYEQDSPLPQTSRNLALALAVEAAELLELYQWDREPAADRLGDELADVVLYTLQLASRNGIELERAVLGKLRHNHDREWPEG